MSEDGIDEPADAKAVQKIADEARAPDHGARGDGAAGVGERKLEQPERQDRHSRRSVGLGRAMQEEEFVADEPVTRAEHERKSKGPEQQPTQTRVDDSLQEDVHCLPGTRETSFQRHESGLHEEHQERRNEGPHRVDGIDVGGGRWRRRIGKGLRAEVRRNAHDHQVQDSERNALTSQDRVKDATLPWILHLLDKPLDHSLFSLLLVTGDPRSPPT